MTADRLDFLSNARRLSASLKFLVSWPGRVTRLLAGSPPFVLTLILAAVFAAYVPIMTTWFLSDDFYYLRAAQTEPFTDYVKNAFDFTRAGSLAPDFLYRPLSLLNFLLLYKAFGLDPWPYHLVSLLAHMTLTGLVWAVARKLSQRDAVAHVAAFVFGLHPVYSPAVAWISNNMSIFAMILSLCSLLLFMTYMEHGPRRVVYYGGSLITMTVALFLHTEAVVLVPTLVIAFALLKREPKRAPSIALWMPIVPHVLAGTAFLGLHAWIRSQSYIQSEFYSLGPHAYENYFLNIARLGSPVSLDPKYSDWLTFLPIALMVLILAYLVARERRRPSVGTFAVLWLFLALVPLSASPSLGTLPRKLYVAGPALALVVALTAVSLWDAFPVALSRIQEYVNSRRSGLWAPLKDQSVAQIRLVVASVLVASLVVLFVLELREQIEPSAMATHGHSGDVSSEAYRAMVDQIREAHPTLPEGSRLGLKNVPLAMLAFGGVDLRLQAAVQLYVGDVAVELTAESQAVYELYHGETTLEEIDLASLATEPEPNNYVVSFDCSDFSARCLESVAIPGGTLELAQLEVTVRSVRHSPPEIESEPPTGHQWLAVDVIVENISGEDALVSPLQTYVDDSAGNQHLPVRVEESSQAAFRSLEPGGRWEERLVYAIPDGTSLVRFVFAPTGASPGQWLLQ